MKQFGPLLFLLFTFEICYSQTDSVIINFIPSFGEHKLETEKKYYLKSADDSVRIESFRFYVSNIIFLKEGKKVYQPEESFHLIDIEKKLKILIPLQSKTDYNAIVFNIGIDSITNVSGALGGDLDPSNGMYWAWQSGYINFKLEGKSKSCNTRNNLFQFHIGGYMTPNKSMQTITFPIRDKSNIDIIVDVEKFLNQIDLTKENEIMSPGEKAVKLSKLYKTVYTIKE